MFKVNNKDIRTTSLTWPHSAVFTVNFEHILYVFLCFCRLLWAISLFNGFLHGRWGWTTEIPIFISLYHFLWFWECSEAAGRICFKREVLFKILQNLQKTTCAGVFLNKARLAKRLRRRCFPVNFSK